MSTRQFTGMSLFSGMGGDTLGMERAGVRVVAYSELMKCAQATHEANFPGSRLLGAEVGGNILKTPDSEFLEYRDRIDFLFAGFPCQSFSSAGKRKMNDPRNTMFREFVRVAKLTRAKVVIGENVKGLLTKMTESGELYIDVIVREFERIGQRVIHGVFKCHEFGVPQKRERLVILGVREDCLGAGDGEFSLQFPEGDAGAIVGVGDIVGQSMERTEELPLSMFDFASLPTASVRENMADNTGATGGHPQLRLKRDQADKSYGGKNFDTLFSFGKRDSPIHCEVMNLENPAKTIICTQDHQPRFFVAMRNARGQFLRDLLADELKQIQGFPRDYQLCGNRKDCVVMIGNAVPPPLIETVVRAVLGT